MLFRSNKKIVMTCPITDFKVIDLKKLEYLAYVSAQVRRKNSADWMDVTFVFHEHITNNLPGGELVYGIANTPEGPREIKVQKGDQIRPVYIAISPDGSMRPWVGNNENAFLQIDDPADFCMDWQGVGANAYQIGFEVINLAGRETRSVGEVRVTKAPALPKPK